MTMQISSILNPAPSSPTTFRRPAKSTTTRRTATHCTPTPSPSLSPSYTPSPHLTSKPTPMKKAPKDVPKWEEGRTIGEVRYPPFPISAEDRKKLETKFEFYAGPLGEIDMYPEHIPYSSEKKSFLAKTGRDGFEVFHYTFRYKDGSDAEKDWVVMWDYNIGLVRITPFFKCMPGHRKTDPKNAILASNGLVGLCHSITGGAILAQGYWLPYRAAFALAATFCHPIRLALTPLFGPPFLSLCVSPSNAHFKRWAIPASIIEECFEQVGLWTKSQVGPGRKGKTGVGSSVVEDGGSGEGRMLRKGSRLRPRDVGVYDESELEPEKEDEDGDNTDDDDDESTSTSTYTATTLPSNTSNMSTSTTWTTANRAIVYPTPPPHMNTSPFLSPSSPSSSKKDTNTSAQASSHHRRKRQESDCVSPRTKKPRRWLPALDSEDDIDTDNEYDNLDDRAKAGTRAPRPTPDPKARVDANDNAAKPTTLVGAEDTRDEEEDDEERKKLEKRRVNRKMGRFYADEYGAAQALLNMSAACWGI